MSSSFERDSREEELLRRANQGDREVLGQLLKDRTNFLFRTCYQILLNTDEAEEAVAETFYRAVNHFRSFHGAAQFSTWLYRVATNVCLDMLRKRKKIVPYEGDTLPLSHSAIGVEEEVVSRLTENDRRIATHTLLKMLPPGSRLVLSLREVEELSYDEIASRLGCSLGTVKSRIFRAKKQALKLIEENEELQSVLLRQKDER